MAKKASTPQVAEDKKVSVKISKAASATPKVAKTVAEPTPVEPTAPAQKTTPVEISAPVEPSAPVAKPQVKAGPYQVEVDLNELLESGAHFGHQARRWHPKMAPYIYAKRDGIHIIDLIKTGALLKEAAEFAYKLGQEGKALIFVGTKRQAKEIVREEASQSGAMYVVNRWLGGFISNWDQVAKSVRRMHEIRKGLEEGTFKHYTKHERLLLEKELQRLERFFGGVADLKQRPDALFVIDVKREETAVKEAKEFGIPVIAVVDTNNDPTLANFVIPANDDAARSIKYVVHVIAESYKAGKAAKK